MGQGDISKILKNKYPEWLTCHDIAKHIDINITSIRRSLKALSTRDEIEIKTVYVPGYKGRNKTYYRTK